MRMGSSRVVSASDCQCQNFNGPWFDLSILQHSGIRWVADEAVFKFKKSLSLIFKIQ
jgi:hypothetical protein